MFAFDIIDGRARNAVPCGRLFYDAERDEWGIQIVEGAGPEEVPFLFSSFVERGERAIGPAWARRWVAERVVPPGRQNLGEVLRANGLREYSEFALLAIGKGACSQDYFVLRGPFPVDDDGEILDDRRQLRQSIGRAVAAARREQTFLVHVRDKIIPLKREDIAFCYTCNEKVTAYTFAGASYPLDKTLEALQAVLPEADFFRANRQFIVARRAVKEISVWFGSRLSLSLVLETPERIVISKARVPEFKAWLTYVQPAE